MATQNLIEHYNTTFAKGKGIRFAEATNGLAKIILHHDCGSSAEIYLNGAVITSFKNAKGEEFLFVSTKAVYENGKPIRGGVPICWPQFGPGELPQHGFARNNQFEVVGTKVDSDGVSVNLRLVENDGTKKLWPNAFQLEYVVLLAGDAGKERLVSTLNVTNKNTDKPFTFTTALHTYFRIQDIERTYIANLKGNHYIDKVRKAETFIEEADVIKFTGETDRVYTDTLDEVQITDTSNNSRTYLLKKNYFSECVVWNPWIQKAKDIADLGDEDWHSFVCAEAGQIKTPVTLQPGQSWSAKQEISLL